MLPLAALEAKILADRRSLLPALGLAGLLAGALRPLRTET